MSIPKEIKKRALEASQSLTPGATDLQIIYELPDFLNGQLLVVQGRHADGERFENHVFVAGSRVRVAKNHSHFAHLVAEEANRRTAFSELMQVGGVAGVIAIIITLTICYMFAVQQVKDIPTVLSTSLATILGFYFGTKAGGQGKERHLTDRSSGP